MAMTPMLNNMARQWCVYVIANEDDSFRQLPVMGFGVLPIKKSTQIVKRKMEDFKHDHPTTE